jgi:superfamily II DNA or RNA helicase
VLIADGVGLGKTIQAGLLVAELCARSHATRALVLVPAGLREQWADELARHFNLQTCNADALWLASPPSGRSSGSNPWSLPGVYVSSHDFVKRPEVLRPLEDVTWDVVVVDEAHAAALHTDRRAAADAIARRSRQVILLTATPRADDPAEFDALCRIGALPDDDPRILVFRRSARDVCGGLPRRSSLLAVRPSSREQRMHELLEAYTRRIWQEASARGDDQAKLVSIVLRKRALSSAGSLLSSVRRRIAMLLGSPQLDASQLRLPLGDEDPLADQEPAALLGTPGLADARHERSWLATIAGAAQHASRTESKMRCLLRLLRRIREPAIIFTEYRDTLVLIERACAARKVEVVTLHGGLSPGERSRVQRRFNTSPVTLLATDAAAEGLNLHTLCRLVIHYELPWSTSRLEQRAGRVDRLGQSRRVHEIGLVAADTAEALVLAPLAARASRAQAAGTPAGGLPSTLSDSRVATLILDQSPGLRDATSSTGTTPAPRRRTIVETPRPALNAEAAGEARRLEQARECVRRSGSFLRDTRNVIVAASVRRPGSRLRGGIYAVYRITLRTRDGRVVSVRPCVFRCHIRSAGSERLRPPWLRAVVEHLAGLRDTQIRHALTRALQTELDEAARYLATVASAAVRRELAMRGIQPGAAWQLVQAGLFDRRVVRQAAAQQRIARSVQEEIGLRLSSFGGPAIVGVEVLPIAALHVAGPENER